MNLFIQLYPEDEDRKLIMSSKMLVTPTKLWCHNPQEHKLNKHASFLRNFYLYELYMQMLVFKTEV